MALMILISLVPQTADASGTNTLELNYSGSFPGRFVISRQAITVESVPAMPEFAHLWLRLNTPSGERVYDEIVDRGAGENVTFPVSVTAGRYYVELFHSAERYTPYRSIVSGTQVLMDWDGIAGTFRRSPVHQINVNARSGKRDDIAALTFYLEPSRNIQSSDPAIQRLAGEITAGITDSYLKTKAIHDWVCNNIYYNLDAYYDRVPFGDTSALAVLRTGRSVCDGYANLLTALLRASGIPAKKVYGYALGISTDGWPAVLDLSRQSNHAWTEAYAGGRWIILDSTWNSGNFWEHNAVTEDKGLRGHRYFDISPEFFSYTHAIRDDSERAVEDFVRRSARGAAVYAGNVRLGGSRDIRIGMYAIDGSNYIRLRDAAALSNMMGGNVVIGWDSATSTITIEHGEAGMGQLRELAAFPPTRAQATLSTARVSLNGENVFMRAYTINDSTWFRLRDVGSLIGIEVGFSGATNTVTIDLPRQPAA